MESNERNQLIRQMAELVVEGTLVSGDIEAIEELRKFLGAFAEKMKLKLEAKISGQQN